MRYGREEQLNEEAVHSNNKVDLNDLMKRVFEGETGAIRDNIVLNAAAGLLISDKVTTIKQGISVVENKINNGLILNKLKSLTQK